LDSIDWKKLEVLGLTRDNVELDAATGVARLTKRYEQGSLGLRFRLPDHAFMLIEPCLRWAYALAAEGARFDLDGQRLVVDVNGVRCVVEGTEDLFVMHEIFAHKIYRVHTGRPVVAWDVGMN